MNPQLQKWQSRLVGSSVRLRGWLRDSGVRISGLQGKPRALWYWLRTAYAAQTVLVLTLLLMPTVIPGGVDRLLERLYPPVKAKQLFGLIHTDQENPLLATRKLQARVLLWSGAGMLFVVLLLRRLPNAQRELHREAQDLEAAGDRQVAKKPSVALGCYQQALALTTDADRSRLLSAKIASLDEDLGWTHKATDTDSDVIAERYRLDAELGRGAMGVVYRAHDMRLERDVALKRMADPGGKDYQLAMRFKQEAKALARLNHPNIIQVYDVTQDQGYTWIAMELVEGTELADRLTARGALPLNEVVALGVELAEAMAYAHERDVVHRDFKPANVLVGRDGHAKIMDFGMARLAHQSGYTVSGTIMGSPAYMSPEQGEGITADARSDIYSLGITLYEMATGKVPFEGDTLAAVIVQHHTREPVAPNALNPAIPPALNALILAMLAKQPAARPATMRDVVRALRAVDPV